MSSKNIAILTATRAEYGLLKPVIKLLSQDPEFNVSVLVTGTHLSADFGYTYKEIEADGIKIDTKIDILTSSDTPSGISASMALATSKFAEYFEIASLEALIVLGDRYETLAVCCAAMNARIPIVHLHGGETTQGAIDEAIRHSITKMSYLHFTSTEEYRKRVIQLGENPQRVFNVGALSVDNIKNLDFLSKQELSKSIEFKLEKQFALVTFHPTTLENQDVEKQFNELLDALDAFPNIDFIITKSNADAGGRKLNQMIDEYERTHENVIAFHSLGLLRYLSAMKYSSMVIGNSSSGIVEAPIFSVPTINIGNRQAGRIRAKSIIDCDCNSTNIVQAIEKALSSDFLKTIKDVKTPYGDGNTSKKIVKVLKKVFNNGEISLQKEFYDINFSY